MTPLPPQSSPTRPADVDTGFWLWISALPLMLIGQFVDAYTVAKKANSFFVFSTTALLALLIGGVVLTFILLMRSGHRWARTVLTGGGVATILYTMLSLSGTPRPTVAAVAYAVTGIVGSVLIAGGIFLLHRPDSTRFFTR
ncbi:MAG: hypothetical protein ACR2JM_03210 [Mycobacterium sp.]